MKNLLGATGLLILLAACQATASAGVSPTPLHGVSFEERGVIVFVTSNGCTRKEDFSVHSDDSVDIPVLRIQRDKHDGCRRARFRRKLLFTWQDLGVDNGQAFTLANPIKPFNAQRFK